MAQVLDELFVDITTRGLDAARAVLDGVTGQVREATAAHKQMRAEMDKAVTVRPRGVSESPERWARQAQSAAPQPRPMADGIRIQPPPRQPTPTQQAAPRPPQDKPAGLADLLSGKSQQSELLGLAKSFAVVTVAVDALKSAVGSVVSLVKQGFAGTVEAEVWGRAVQQVAREFANFFAPAVRLASDLLNRLTATFRGTGAAGQQLVQLLTPLGWALMAINDPQVGGAMRQLGWAMGEVVRAAQPLLNALANVGSFLLRAFVIDPLVGFVKTLVVAVELIALMVRGLSDVATAAGRLVGMGRVFDAPKQGRQEVTLSQTGTESPDATFQRIQQSVLKMGLEKQEDPAVSELKKIREFVKKISDFIDNSDTRIKDIRNSPPGQFAEGAVKGGPLGPLGPLFGLPFLPGM